MIWAHTPKLPMMLTGVPVYTSEWVPDGRVLKLDRGLYIGVSRETDDQHEARRIVREGLSDVLQWLGEPALTGRQVIDALKEGS